MGASTDASVGRNEIAMFATGPKERHILTMWTMFACLLVNQAHAQPPKIVSLYPDHIYTGSPTKVIILGSNFQVGAQVRVRGDAVPAERVSSNQIEAMVTPRGDGPVTVSVQNPNGLAGFLPFGLTYQLAGVEASPQVASAANESIPTATGTRVLGAPILINPPVSGGIRVTDALDPAAAKGALDFLAALSRGEDVRHLLVTKDTSGILASDPIFAFKFTSAHHGQAGTLKFIHFGGVLESVTTTGQRAWFPFWLDMSTDAPGRVLLYFRGNIPGTDADTLVDQARTRMGSNIEIDTNRFLFPLPGAVVQ
jgi:hypothetical protein